ncbi:rubrerythrin [Desulforhopalus singaporensis]|uniref:Rubrerythrin n=1 Tax=Desulforhopalus singaporensis TaxID=91360 RepID=A0A1H0TPP4_9BACT|nr:ferritin family protein [Desulforhopalus singaporensis]SDP55608.1 Rubrerythrin [Desulforhopalus singaporensis]
MGKFRESRTAHNLLLSYSAEAQARTRYNFFATRAHDEGLIQIGRLFDETAAQEYEHALRFFNFFNGGELTITGAFPAGVIKDTRSNLIASAALELYVHDEMYAVFAEVAEAEGFARAADTFNAINVSEKNHEIMFRELAENLATGKTFQKESVVTWKCLSCGYLHHGKTPPDKCPACVKPPGYFEILKKNW